MRVVKFLLRFDLLNFLHFEPKIILKFILRSKSGSLLKIQKKSYNFCQRTTSSTEQQIWNLKYETSSRMQEKAKNLNLEEV